MEHKLDLKKWFGEAKKYLKSSLNFVYASIVIFLVSAVFGFAFRQKLGFIDELLKGLIEKTANLDSAGLILFIFQNNLQSSFFSLILGVFIGLFPLFSTISNGVVLGYVLGKAYEITGVTSWWRLFPHGIFELPAIFISLGLGIKLGWKLLTNYFKRYWKENKLLIFLPAAFAVLSTILVLISKTPIYEQIPFEVPYALFVAAIFAVDLASYFMMLILITYFTDKKLKAIQREHLTIGFYGSMKVFLTIVIPLLIVAAIIEGLLIGLLG